MKYNYAYGNYYEIQLDHLSRTELFSVFIPDIFFEWLLCARHGFKPSGNLVSITDENKNSLNFII